MSERSGTFADDPFGGRQPTSHERLTGQPWDASYQGGPAPWDIGGPQPAVLDCGLFHTFNPDERPAYIASLASVTNHNATLYVLCFSNNGPDIGPHPISQDDLRAAFTPTNGWNITTISPDRVQTRFHDDNGAPAWLATIKRI